VYRLAWRGPTAIWQPGVPATCGFGAWARSPRFGVSMARRPRPHLLFPAMSGLTFEERFRRWQLPWKERVCEEVRPFSHGTVFRSPRHPDFWEYNCIRLDRPMDAGEMIAAADRELADCAHRYVEWMIPMPDRVVGELRETGWIANPLIFMLHDGRVPPEGRGELVEVDYDAVRELRDIWHREDFGEHTETAAFHAQAREVAELADVRVIAAVEEGRPIGFAEVETHDGGSEVTQVFVRPERRGAGFGGALTARAIGAGADAAPDVWICAGRDDRPRRLYERLGFRAVIETGIAILPPKP
jgi:GNAT superfamily N-acetyltransferase